MNTALVPPRHRPHHRLCTCLPCLPCLPLPGIKEKAYQQTAMLARKGTGTFTHGAGKVGHAVEGHAKDLGGADDIGAWRPAECSVVLLMLRPVNLALAFRGWLPSNPAFGYPLAFCFAPDVLSFACSHCTPPDTPLPLSLSTPSPRPPPLRERQRRCRRGAEWWRQDAH